jgi:hypothetical protein
MRLTLSIFLQYVDYTVRVLMPEVMIKIVMDMNNISHDEAEEYMFNSWWVSIHNKHYPQQLLSDRCITRLMRALVSGTVRFRAPHLLCIGFFPNLCFTGWTLVAILSVFLFCLSVCPSVCLSVNLRGNGACDQRTARDKNL